MKVLVYLFVFLMMVTSAAFAAGPSRDQLIAHWENAQKTAPETLTFEATGKEGVYRFETTFFPYKGRLRLLNAVVTRQGDGYVSDLYTGIVEVELPDAGADFMRKYAMSYAAWLGQNRFFYDAKKNVWFSGTEWSEHFSPDDGAQETASRRNIGRLSAELALIAGLLVLIVFLVRFGRRQHARAWEAQALMMERQKRSLEIAEEGLSVSRAILDELKKRP